MRARRVSLNVFYAGVDISEFINNDLIGFSYIDNASGSSDDTRITLQDKGKKWMNSWFPGTGDIIYATIHLENWTYEGDNRNLPCGRFFIDNPKYSGRASTLNIKAVSAPLNKEFKDRERSKAWRNISFREIASDIASRSGLQLETYLNGNNPVYEHKEQNEQSDADFLSDLCEDEGLAMKLTDEKIIIFDEEYFEQQESIAEYSEEGNNVLSYNFEERLNNTAYDGVQIDYFDSNQGQNITFLYAPEDVDEDSKIYKINRRVNSAYEAKRLARKKFQELNKRKFEANITVVGDFRLLGSACVDLTNFGVFSGKYFIESATHNVGGGYTTQIIARLVEGF